MANDFGITMMQIYYAAKERHVNRDNMTFYLTEAQQIALSQSLTRSVPLIKYTPDYSGDVGGQPVVMYRGCPVTSVPDSVSVKVNGRLFNFKIDTDGEIIKEAFNV